MAGWKMLSDEFIFYLNIDSFPPPEPPAVNPSSVPNSGDDYRISEGKFVNFFDLGSIFSFDKVCSITVD